MLALVKAEKRRQKKSQLASTPHNLSIHKDLSSEEEYQPSSGSSIPVLKTDDGGEVLMGEFPLSSSSS